MSEYCVLVTISVPCKLNRTLSVGLGILYLCVQVRHSFQRNCIGYRNVMLFTALMASIVALIGPIFTKIIKSTGQCDH